MVYSLDNLFLYLREIGFMTFLLPALFIFAITFAIINKTKVIGDIKLEVPIALLIGLMGAQFEFVQCVFADILPRLAIALVIILVFWILAGLFIDAEAKGVQYVFILLTIIIFTIIFYTSECPFNLGLASWFFANWPWIVLLAVLLGVIIAVVRGEPSKPNKWERQEAKEKPEDIDPRKPFKRYEGKDLPPRESSRDDTGREPYGTGGRPKRPKWSWRKKTKRDKTGRDPYGTTGRSPYGTDPREDTGRSPYGTGSRRRGPYGRP
jgi:hypothetical protein